LVNIHDKGEFVPIRHDFPVRHVMAMANAAVAAGTDRFTPHWRLCDKLALWRARIADKASIRGCIKCGQPMVGALADPSHKSCRDIPNIYVAARKPFSDGVWEGLPGADVAPARRTGEANQCIQQTRYQGQCIRNRDTDPGFTGLYAEYCKQHNPARMCHRTTRAQKACPDYTGDGSACDYHDGLPRLDQRLHPLPEPEKLVVEIPEEDPAADVEDINEEEPPTERGPRWDPEFDPWSSASATDSLDLDTPAPKLPTPWRNLSERLHGGFDFGQVVTFSAGNHHYASELLATLTRYVRARGFRTVTTSCRRTSTTVQSLIEWVQDQIDADVDVILVDWFPNLTDPEAVTQRDADSDAGFDVDDVGGAAPGAEEAIVSATTARLHRMVARKPVILLLGVCMDGAARNVADSPSVANCLLRGNGTVEGIAGTVVICYPDKHNGDAPAAFLYSAPMDVAGQREHFPLNSG
jgi:hypothetical protein